MTFVGAGSGEGINIPAGVVGDVVTEAAGQGVASTVPGAWPNQVVAVTSNAGTVNPTLGALFTFTNSSAATMAITIATTGAIDGQRITVRVYDFSAAAQTIGWTNTENGEGTAPVTSNGSTTLPKTVIFDYNAATSKWRCVVT